MHYRWRSLFIVVNATYLTAGHHSWLPVLLLAGTQVIAITLLLTLYTRMRKKMLYTQTNDSDTLEDTVQLIALEEITEQDDELDESV